MKFLEYLYFWLTLPRRLRDIEECLIKVSNISSNCQVGLLEHLAYDYHLIPDEKGNFRPHKFPISLEKEFALRKLRDSLTEIRDNLNPPAKGSDSSGKD